MSKVRTSVTVDKELLEQAKQLDSASISQAFESFLKERIRKLKEQKWREDNKEAIQRINAYAEKNDTFGMKHGAMFSK